MTAGSPIRGFPWLDALLLAATVAGAAWVGLLDVYELEAALHLEPKQQWFDEMARHVEQLQRAINGPIKTPRERFAKAYPRSLLAKLNRNPAMIAVWSWCARIQERALPCLVVAGVGIGLVAMRRPGSRRERSQWGPGRVAAAVSFMIAGIDILQEFILRRFDLQKHGAIHDALPGLWPAAAQHVGIGILAAWVLLACARRWRLGRGWRERLGLGLGGAWMAALLWVAVAKPLAQF